MWVSDDGFVRNGSTAFSTDRYDEFSLQILIKALKENQDITLVPFTHVAK